MTYLYFRTAENTIENPFDTLIKFATDCKEIVLMIEDLRQAQVQKNVNAVSINVVGHLIVIIIVLSCACSWLYQF